MRRNLLYAFVIIVMTLLVLGAISFFQHTLSPEQYNKIALIVAVLVGVVGLLGSIPGVQEFFRSIQNGINQEFVLSPAQRKHNRQIMLQKVKLDWIEGVLEASLHGAVLMQLGIKYMPEMVEHPWDAVLQRPRHKDRKLSKNTNIFNIYTELGGSLLILGDPGSGKTTTLLELTRELIRKAQNEEVNGIPVVFNLSTWGINRGEIEKWLINELQLRYQIPVNVGTDWVKQNELILMLDGLDEISEEFRDECVEKINDFKSKHLVNVVISSRTNDYKYLENKLMVPGAIAQMPLTPQQIDKYLADLGSKLAHVRKAVEKDKVLLDLAKSPLVLSIMAMAYQDLKAGDLRPGTLEEQRDHLFQTYVRRMFEHKKVRSSFTSEQIINGLMWLARLMVKKAQTIFRIEQLQPGDIKNTRGRKLYSLVLSLSLWIFVSFSFGLACGISIYFIINSASGGIIGGILFGITGGLAIWIIESGFYNLFYRILMGGFTGISMGYLIWLFNQNLLISVLATFVVGLAVVYTFGSIGVNGTYQGSSNVLSAINIRNLDWDLKAGIIGFLRRLRIGLFIGIGGGLATAGLFGLEKGLLIGIGFMLATALVGGLAYGNIDSKIDAVYRPNEGTWRSLKNALKLGIGSGIILGIILGTLVAMLSTPYSGLISGVCFFFAAFIIDGLVSGGLQVLQHAILRTILYFEEETPLNYPLFLSQAVYHIFLLNVGNGYIFFHRLLLEYFASRKQTSDSI